MKAALDLPGAAPAQETTDHTCAGHAWRTVLFNCDCHSFDQVENQLIKVVHCTLSRARQLSWQVHSQGSAVVYNGPRERCEAVAECLGAIGLRVGVTQ
ncbi:MAG: ATP-dependent Clp protease adaptor ClpS [Elusimicrobia bacterium]|nr:ATP-dependent Clp protease adaptor ClpS [Elusimicrobiota bacterium]